jgi:hypothetical protein
MSVANSVFDLPADIEDQPLEDRAALAAELRRRAVFLNERADQLDGDVLLTVQEAAELCGRTDECVRVWIREHVGEFNPVARRFMIRRSRLVAHVLTTQGVLPAGLRAPTIVRGPRNLSPLKSETA